MSNIGKRVSVAKIRNGYRVGCMTGTITNENETKYQVSTWQKGNRWYSKRNVTILNK